MSHMDAPTLEFFVQDSFFGNVTEAQLAAIVVILEPEREWIEDKMSSDYDADTMSWRSYRNALWSYLEKYEAAIREVV